MIDINFLSSSILISPKILQFAKDGKFEESWIIKKDQFLLTDQEIDAYLNKEPYKQLIVEYIWNNDQDDKRYVFTLKLDDTCILKDHKEFIHICLELLNDSLDFKSIIQTLDEKVIGHPYLFSVPVDLIRMGIFNFWFSVGPVDLWKQGEDFSEQTTLSRLQSRPEIMKSTLNYQGLAFIFNSAGTQNGPNHILKTPCCKKIGNEWVVDKELTINNMKKFLL